MKAQFGAKWAILILVITVILIIAVIVPYNNAMKEAIKTSAYIHGTEISGIINLLHAAPNTTTYLYLLPDKDCEIIIGEDVNFTVMDDEKGNSFVIDLIKSDVRIVGTDPSQPFPVVRQCEHEEGYPDAILFTRKDNSIIVY